MASTLERIPVEGVVAVEGQPTGDGRMFEYGSLRWEDVLPVAIIWDRQEGDHTAMTVGAVETLERRDDGVIWMTGYLSASQDPETQAAVTRVSELLDEGAVGVSIRWDDVTMELRVPREMVEMQEGDLLPTPIRSQPGVDDDEDEDEEEDDRVVVARMCVNDVLQVTTSGRVRHLAIVDTAAFHNTRIGRAVATGAIAASALVGDWEGRETWFLDPAFGEPHMDSRLRYDADTQKWSCPPTLTDDGRVFGHVAPMGLCLRGRPDKCVTPPDGDLNGFMRAYAPAAGGKRTGVICVGGGHAAVGIGAAEATRHYDDTGRAVADVCVGKDRYGIWFAGMARPGASKDDLYTFASSDVSGHWEYNRRGKMVMVGLPCVNVGGFPKGVYTYDEFRSGLAASADLSDCGCGDVTDEVFPDTGMQAQLSRIETAVAELYAEFILRSQSA